MLRTPAVDLAGRMLHLPVSIGSGAALAAELLTPEIDLAALAAILKNEPGLLVWVALRAEANVANSAEDFAKLLPGLLRSSPLPWTAAAQGETAAAWQAFRRQGKKLAGNIAGLLELARASVQNLAESRIDLKRGAKTADEAAIGLARVLNSLRTKGELPPAGVEASQQLGSAVDLAALEEAKQQALYHFAYGLSHEINNPLANISLRAQTLQADETHPEKRRKLAVIQQQANKAFEMIAALMLYAHPPSPKFERVAIDEIFAALQEEWELRAAAQNTELTFESEVKTFVRGDAVQLRHALQALLQNALEAVRSGGRVAVRIETVESSATISVQDTGPGIRADLLPRIFDPFFSGREAGRGLGLGLSQCWRIVELHAGKMEASSAAGRTEFRMLLPLTAANE